MNIRWCASRLTKTKATSNTGVVSQRLAVFEATRIYGTLLEPQAGLEPASSGFVFRCASRLRFCGFWGTIRKQLLWLKPRMIFRDCIDPQTGVEPVSFYELIRCMALFILLWFSDGDFLSGIKISVREVYRKQDLNLQPSGYGPDTLPLRHCGKKTGRRHSRSQSTGRHPAH